MQRRSPQAGGFLLVLAMLIGLFLGIRAGQLVYGFLIGTAVGAVLALAIWLIDRRRV